ncbi:hypothetical protein GUJ93_ZPchr0002g22952 [Zizania palustris]|uniref:Uncharacterized protein n=1 Tax=Zizania palustris TaxID=103762 RepID=A0A8J5SGD7_ZIZPA|nr:hypothetical protein GUJ93_ZPchr0002g22952 [Zizania palustris]
MVCWSVCSSARNAGDLFPARAQQFPLTISVCARTTAPFPSACCATIAPPSAPQFGRWPLPHLAGHFLEPSLSPPAPPTISSTTKSQTLARQQEDEELGKNARKFTHKNFESVTKKLRSQFTALAKMLDYNALGGKPNSRKRYLLPAPLVRALNGFKLIFLYLLISWTTLKLVLAILAGLGCLRNIVSRSGIFSPVS